MYVDGEPYIDYPHRCSPQDAHHLTVNGDVSALDVGFLGAFVSIVGLSSC